VSPKAVALRRCFGIRDSCISWLLASVAIGHSPSLARRHPAGVYRVYLHKVKTAKSLARQLFHLQVVDIAFLALNIDAHRYPPLGVTVPLCTASLRKKGPNVNRSSNHDVCGLWSEITQRLSRIRIED
jgi:hypothetical protein